MIAVGREGERRRPGRALRPPLRAWRGRHVLLLAALGVAACAPALGPDAEVEVGAGLEDQAGDEVGSGDDVEVGDEARAGAGVVPPPRGFRLAERTEHAPRMLSALVRSESTTPLRVSTSVFVPAASDGVPEGSEATGASASASGAITLTVATYATTAGALATYNGWFAEFGFPAAAERTSLDFGEAAERFDLVWPPLHAVIARDGEHFSLVVGDAELLDALRSEAMEALARAGLASARSGGGSAGTGTGAVVGATPSAGSGPGSGEP